MPRQTDLELDDLIRFYENYHPELGVPKCLIADEIAVDAVAGNEKAYDYLKNLLRDPDTGVRYIGIAATRESGRSEGMQVLREYLTRETNTWLREIAAQAIESLARVN